MFRIKAYRVFNRIDLLEFNLCRRFNRTARYRLVRDYFRVVSRLGDGWFWYALILAMPFVAGPRGWSLAFAMTATGVVCTLLYKALKHTLVRERPFIADPGIDCRMAPLDRYSFPSGHTLHAVAFNTLLFPVVPSLALAVLPFTLSVMASRVVLGLHYPSDVLAGALVGLLLGAAGLTLLPVS